MTYLILFIAAVPASLVALWHRYVFVMSIKHAKDAGKLYPEARYLSAVPAAIGIALDVWCNLIAASIITLDPPREWLVTARLKRYMAQGSGWRCRMARYICSRLLEPFDPGHCGP